MRRGSNPTATRQKNRSITQPIKLRTTINSFMWPRTRSCRLQKVSNTKDKSQQKFSRLVLNQQSGFLCSKAIVLTLRHRKRQQQSKCWNRCRCRLLCFEWSPAAAEWCWTMKSSCRKWPNLTKWRAPEARSSNFWFQRNKSITHPEWVTRL